MIKDKELKDWIKHYEGFNHLAYRDSEGKLTIGWGRNIEDRGITKEEAEFMLENDIQIAYNDLKGFTWYLLAPDGVKRALVNMCYNMGISRLLNFKKMIQALIKRDYTQASLEALDSQWAKQVGQRAKDIAVMIREDI